MRRIERPPARCYRGRMQWWIGDQREVLGAAMFVLLAALALTLALLSFGDNESDRDCEERGGHIEWESRGGGWEAYDVCVAP